MQFLGQLGVKSALRCAVEYYSGLDSGLDSGRTTAA